MSEFREHYWGRFSACLRWEQAESLAERLAASGWTWYAVVPESPPVTVEELSAEEAAARFREHLAEMRRLKRGDYCNLVFVDDTEVPTLIKAFHPKRAGDACRVSGDSIPPWLVLSQHPVDPTVFAGGVEEEQERPAWLQRIFPRADRL